MGTTARRRAGTPVRGPVTALVLILVTALALTLGLLLAGAGTARADDPGTTAAPGPQGPITLSAEQATYVCQQRIPTILSRIDRLTGRIGGDAGTFGSTAWLRARHDRAQAAGRTDLADQIEKRIDGRPDKLTELADARTRLTGFRDANCTAS